jgi:hypothetical protein
MRTTPDTFVADVYGDDASHDRIVVDPRSLDA